MRNVAHAIRPSSLERLFRFANNERTNFDEHTECQRSCPGAFRVLKPGGRFAVSDVVFRGNVPAEIKKSIELWVGCVAGALSDYEYVAKLSTAGFDNINIE